VLELQHFLETLLSASTTGIILTLIDTVAGTLGQVSQRLSLSPTEGYSKESRKRIQEAGIGVIEKAIIRMRKAYKGTNEESDAK
jgi:hypothetical protein